MKTRIIEYKDGFEHYFIVQYKVRILFWSRWKSVRDYDVQKRFVTLELAREYSESIKVPPKYIIYN
jgi:hypothetical protein